MDQSRDSCCDRQSGKCHTGPVRASWAVMNAMGQGMTLFFEAVRMLPGQQEWFSEKSKIGDVGADD